MMSSNNALVVSETAEQAARRLSQEHIDRGFRPESLHEYTDSNGSVTYYRIRLKHPNGEKWIRPMHQDTNGQYYLGEPPKFKDRSVLKPLYGLALINQYPNAEVFIVEGENPADKLNKFFIDQDVTEQYIAITSGGTTSANGVDWQPLSKRSCILWADNDQTGEKCMQEISYKLVQIGCELKLVDTRVLGLPEKGDCVDWLRETPRTLEDLLAMPYLKPENIKKIDTGSEKIIAVTLSELLSKDLPPRENILDPWLPKAGLCMVYAERGVGKTFFALEVAMAVAYGDSYLSFQASKPRRVLYIDGEMPANTMQERLAQIESRKQSNPDMIDPIFITPDFQLDPMLNLSFLEDQERLAEHVEGADLIIIDNISTLCGHGKENEADSWLPIQQWVLQLRRQGKAVLFVHHAGKNGTQRGTSKREDILDTVIKLKRPSDYEASMGACFELHFEKSRGIMGEDVTPIRCQLGNEGWEFEAVEISNYQKVIELLNAGRKQKEIVDELDLSKSQVSKLAAKARAEGNITVG